MTYVGYIIDAKACEYYHRGDSNIPEQAVLFMNIGLLGKEYIERINNFKTWPGQKISDKATIEIISEY